MKHRHIDLPNVLRRSVESALDSCHEGLGHGVPAPWPIAVNAVANFAGTDIFRVPGEFRIESFNPSANYLPSQCVAYGPSPAKAWPAPPDPAAGDLAAHP
jgi:hypothetical protein